jgi:hypothetical protein
MRDLGAVFVPVTIKGFRTITTVFGRKIANPVRVQTTRSGPMSPPFITNAPGVATAAVLPVAANRLTTFQGETDIPGEQS